LTENPISNLQNPIFNVRNPTFKVVANRVNVTFLSGGGRGELHGGGRADHARGAL
jgi:hypothetical protein